MNIISILYFLLIRPLELIYEFIFSVSYQNSGNAFFSIVILSISVGLLSLPLYNRADKLQQESTVIEKHMKPGKDRIKKAFKGDEQVLLLQAYYKEKHYHPLMILRSSFSLLLQIPFFIAAYRMLSSCIVLRGSPLGPIADLGAPDGMLRIGNAAVNVLPVLMTVINIISGTVYSKGMGLRAKLQLYITALIFLVLLYGSPSGLVLYWTLNNLFSLIKNIAGRFMPKKNKVRAAEDKAADRSTSVFFLMYSLCLSLFIGFLIPSEAFVPFVADFMTNYHIFDLPHYLWISFFITAGFFTVWGSIYFFILRAREKGVYIMALLLISAVFDYFVFYRNNGNRDRYLFISQYIDDSIMDMLINVVVIILIAALLFIIMRHRPKAINILAIPVTIGLVILVAVNMVKLERSVRSFGYTENQRDYPRITLSQDGKNVVVIMLDRAMGQLIPYIVNENPDLISAFDGFTYYSSALSFGRCTITGAPAIYGGYEYTPQALNARTDESLADKHDESLLVLPVLFGQNGYDVTVMDPPFAGYKWIGDLSIFDGYPYIDSYISSEIMNPYFDEMTEDWSDYMERNTFSYSIRMASPVFIRKLLYDDGFCNDLNRRYSNVSYFQSAEDMSHATGSKFDFLNTYSVLLGLSDITSVSEPDSSEGSLLILTNTAAHEPQLLEEPGYGLSRNIDNEEYDLNNAGRFTNGGVQLSIDNIETMSSYQSQAASLEALGDWFDYLREIGVYDNTRIILVSDHGPVFRISAEERENVDGVFNINNMNCLLMVKDFDSNGFTVSDSFITNAEVPVICARGLIDDPVNPFTGNPLRSELDHPEDFLYFMSVDHNVRTDSGNVFEPAAWYSYDPGSGDIYDTAAWEYNGFY